MSQKGLTISAIVIAKNEEERIGKCLSSLSFADEIIVFDNGSNDKTAQIARSYHALVQMFHTSDFAKLRNEAAKMAKYEWLLYVDADEIVTDGLAKSIQERNIASSGFELYRKNFYLGEPWPGGEWMLRIFKKEAFQKWQGALHESPMIKGNVGRLHGDLLHTTHRTLSEMVAKTNEWSETEAKLRFDTHHPLLTWWRVLRVMLTAFWDSYIKQEGWRVSTVGIIESLYQAFSIFITYAKLWELQEKSQKFPRIDSRQAKVKSQKR